MIISEARRRKKSKRQVRVPSLSLVVARSYPDNVIGCENNLPWKLRSDLQRFRGITTGHAVVMGRKTFESIGRPLPNRFNVVLSSGETKFNNDCIFVNNKESAQFFADFYSILRGQKEYFIVGGGSVYDMFVETIDKIYLTEVFTGSLDGDAHFNWKIDKRIWRLVDEIEVPKSDVDEWPSRFTIWQRKQEFIRVKDIIDFMTYDKVTEIYVGKMIENIRKTKSKDVELQVEQALLPFML